MIVVASLIGALLPFCSCGVIPLVAGLLSAAYRSHRSWRSGFHRPLMDPTQFFLAAGVMGGSFAIAKVISAVGMGMLSGFGTMILIRLGWFNASASLRIGCVPSMFDSLGVEVPCPT
jgi:uncharacterized protein